MIWPRFFAVVCHNNYAWQGAEAFYVRGGLAGRSYYAGKGRQRDYHGRCPAIPFNVVAPKTAKK